MANFEIIELLIDETKNEYGINAVSVVRDPAIEENFVALNKHEVELKEVDTEKRILMGAALIPNKQIYRRNKDKESEDAWESQIGRGRSQQMAEVSQIGKGRSQQMAGVSQIGRGIS